MNILWPFRFVFPYFELNIMMSTSPQKYTQSITKVNLQLINLPQLHFFSSFQGDCETVTWRFKSSPWHTWGVSISLMPACQRLTLFQGHLIHVDDRG